MINFLFRWHAQQPSGSKAALRAVRGCGEMGGGAEDGVRTNPLPPWEVNLISTGNRRRPIKCGLTATKENVTWMFMAAGSSGWDAPPPAYCLMDCLACSDELWHAYLPLPLLRYSVFAQICSRHTIQKKNKKNLQFAQPSVSQLVVHDQDVGHGNVVIVMASRLVSLYWAFIVQDKIFNY